MLVQLIEIVKFSMDKTIIPIQLVAFSFATKSLVHDSDIMEFVFQSAADILNYFLFFAQVFAFLFATLKLSLLYGIRKQPT